MSDLAAVLPSRDPKNGDLLCVLDWARARPLFQAFCRRLRVEFTHTEGGQVHTVHTDPDRFMPVLVPGDSAIMLRSYPDGRPRLLVMAERITRDRVLVHYVIGSMARSPLWRQALWDLGVRQIDSVIRKTHGMLQTAYATGALCLGETDDHRYWKLRSTMEIRP